MSNFIIRVSHLFPKYPYQFCEFLLHLFSLNLLTVIVLQIPLFSFSEYPEYFVRISTFVALNVLRMVSKPYTVLHFMKHPWPFLQIPIL